MSQVVANLSQFARKYAFVTALSLSAIVVGSVAAFLPMAYEENDDICMLLIASGSYSGTPDPHLMFINYCFGLILNQFYSRLPSVEWYTLSFVLLHFMSLCAILFSLLTKRVSSTLKWLLIALLCLIDMKLLLRLQFTTTAAIATLSGIALMRTDCRYRRMIGVVFVVLGAMVRFEAAMLLVLVISPLFLLECFEQRKIWGTAPTVHLAMGLLLASSLQFIDHLAYQRDTAWQTYREQVRLRAGIHDNPNARHVRDKLQELVSDSNYSLLLAFTPNGDAVNSASLRKIDRVVRDVPIFVKLRNVTPALAAHAEYGAIVLIAMAALFAAAPTPSRRIAIVLHVAAFLVALTIVSLDRALKYRVFISAFLPLVYLLGVYSEHLHGRHRHADLCVHFCVVLLCGGFIVAIAKNIAAGRANDSVFVQQHDLIGTYLSSTNKSIIPIKADYSMECQSPFFVSRNHFPRRMFFGGWMTGMPLNRGRYESFKDFVDGHALFMSKASQSDISLIVESIYDTYGLRVTPVKAMESPSFAIVELKSR